MTRAGTTLAARTRATPVADPATASVGRRFELLRTLGVGSFGTVYLAEMESSGGFRRRVALKLLNPTWDQQSDASTRLRDEARLLGRLEHRHIVRVDDLLRLDGRWALLMEYVEGVDLECVVSPPGGVEMPGFSPRAALDVVQAVAAALWAAAETPGADNRPLAVVHRDIKPSNIRVTTQGDVKVLDFGVARADFVGREARTERVRYGSIGYMSPERLLGGDETSAGDVYALGVVLYELMMGKSYGRCELGPAQQEAQVAAAVEEAAEVAGQDIAILMKDMLAYEAEDRPSGRKVEERARALVAGRAEPDLAAWSALVVPLLDRPPADDGDVAGRVLAESDVSGRAIVNSATMVLPDGDPLPSPPTPAVRHSTETIATDFGEDEAKVGGPKRAAWAAGIATVLGLLLAVAWVVTHPEEGGGLPGSGPVAAPVEVAAIAVPPAGEAAAPVEVATPVAAPLVAAPLVAAPVDAAPKAGSSTPKGSDRSARPAPSGAVPSAPGGSDPVLPPTPVPTADLLRSAKFVVSGSEERMDVQCGSVSAGGSGNALVQNFPAGSCTVRVGGVTTSVSVQEPRKVECTFEGGTLSCR
jgi:serine/threonine protein kinase